jgi:voltage-gated potassium channel Kch
MLPPDDKGKAAKSAPRRLTRAEFLDHYRQHRFAWLFLSLLLTITLGAALEALAPRIDLLQLFLAVTLLAAIASAVGERWILSLSYLGVAFLLTRVVQLLVGTQALLSLSQVLWVLAALLAMAAAVRHALRAGPVNAERIFAALDAYLLAGLIFGVCYWLLDQTQPASFGPAENPLPLAHAIYFSFVTIATLGYGDIVPRSELARGLATLEAVSGQLYLAVLVARLVSLYAKQADG